MLKFRKYRDSDIEAWNRFVAKSKNGTFLFDRRYMDYHRERFRDASLLVLDERDDLIALFPANSAGQEVHSHGGLTYGGVISDHRMTTTRMVDIFTGLLRHLASEGISTVLYKLVPSIYHKLPSDEDQYALFLNGAELKRRDVLSVIPTGSSTPLQSRRRRGANRAASAGIVVEESDDFASFWPVLEANLEERFDQRPVHSLPEIELLHRLFPSNIRLYVARSGGNVVAGAVMYLTDQVAHAQYIANSAAGRDAGALDLLFIDLFVRMKDFRHFDFGISTEENGLKLNKGLIDFKEGFGARAIVHDHYLLKIS
jgi:hypothetical protein